MTMQMMMEECRGEGRAEDRAISVYTQIQNAAKKLGSLEKALDFEEITLKEYEDAKKLVEDNHLLD